MTVPQWTEPSPASGWGVTRSLCSYSILVCPCGGRQGAEPTMLSQRADLPQDPVHPLPLLAILPEAAGDRV